MTYIFSAFSALFLLLHIPICIASSNLKGDAACSQAMCVVATADHDVITYELSTTLGPFGWIALGFGERMLNTHSVIFWKNKDDGSTVMSQRYATRYAEPNIVDEPPSVAKIVEAKHLLKPAHASETTFAFQIPANSTLFSSTGPRKPYIFACSTFPPEGQGASARLSVHRQVGFITLDITKDFSPPSSDSSSLPPSNYPKPNPKTKPNKQGTITQGTNLHYSRMEKLIILHGFFASLGFLVILPAGSLVARYSRAFTVGWFKYHWKTNLLIAGPVITFGVALGPVIVQSKKSYKTHFANAHEIYGILLLILYYAQVMLGRYIHERRNKLARLGPISRPHPPLNILHIVLGVSIISFAFFQVRTGMEWWEILTGRGPITSWALPLWKSWIPILFLAYFGGYILLSRQLHLERQAAYRPLPRTNGSEISQSTPFLADQHEVEYHE